MSDHKITNTQRAVLLAKLNGKPSGIQSNHYIMARRALLKKGLLVINIHTRETELSDTGEQIAKNLI